MVPVSTATTSPQAASAAERSAIMASTIESQCREFAAQFPTPNVQRAIALCESGRISWEDAYGVFTASLSDGLKAVGA